MGESASQDIEALFGSRNRAWILGYLAAAGAPPTGYTIAKELRIGESKVYPELKRLEKGGFVSARLDSKGRRRFVLADEDLSRLLRRRLRILRTSEWFAPAFADERERRTRAAERIPLKDTGRPDPKVRRKFAQEFERPPEKDRALKRLGLRPTRRR